MIILIMYGLLFLNYLMMGSYIGNFLINSQYLDLILAMLHFFISMAMHAGIEQAKEEDEDDDF